MDEMDEWQWTGNGIGDDGAVALDVFARGMLCDVCGYGNRK